MMSGHVLKHLLALLTLGLLAAEELRELVQITPP
jgi:hypothetical protein